MQPGVVAMVTAVGFVAAAVRHRARKIGRAVDESRRHQQQSNGAPEMLCTQRLIVILFA